MGRSYNKKNNNPNHEFDDSIHPRKLPVGTGPGGALPSGTQYQTLVKGSSVWQATSILETRADGSYVKASSGDTVLKLRDINDTYNAYHYKYDTDNAYVIKNEADVSFSDVVLHTHFNTDFSDSSDYNHVESVGDATITSTAKFGAGAALFNNPGGIASDHLTYIQQGTEFVIGTKKFGISMWIKPLTLKSGDNFILINGWASPGLGNMYGIKYYCTSLDAHNNPTAGTLYFYSNAGIFHCGWTPTLYNDDDVYIGTQHNIEVDFDGTDCYIFIGGASQVVTVDTVMGNISANNDIDVGAGQLDLVGYSYYGFDGIIDEVYFKIDNYLHIADFDVPITEFPDSSMSGDNEIIRAEKSSDIYTQDVYIGSEGMRIIFLGEVIGSSGSSINLRHNNLENLGWADAGHTTPIPLAYGGTAKALTASNGGIVYTDADSMEILSGTATAQKLLMSQSNTAPVWSTPTYPNSATVNKVLRGDGTNVVLSTFTIPDTFLINTIPYASAANEVSFGTTLPTHTVTTQLTTLKIEGGVASGGNLTLSSTSHATKGKVYFGTTSVYDQVNDRLGIGSTAPANIGVFQKNQNDLTVVDIANTTSNNSARSGIRVTSDPSGFTSQGFLFHHNTSLTFGTGFELLIGRRVVLGATGTQNGLTILTGDNTDLILATGGYATANNRLTISGTGAFTIPAWTTAGFVKNSVAGLLSGGNSLAVADVPTMTSAEFATKISDETGTDKVVFNTSPTFVTQITTPKIVATAAALDIQPTTDGVNSVRINDKDGNSLISVDTTNDRIGFLTTAPDVDVNVKKTYDGIVTLRVTNPSDGVSARAVLSVYNDVSLAFFAAYSSNFSTAAWANHGAVIAGSSLTGLVLSHANHIQFDDASAVTKFNFDVVNGILSSGNMYPIADDTCYLGKNSISSPLAWKGVVVKDTTNGNYYRVEVINGVVTPTQIT